MSLLAAAPWLVVVPTGTSSTACEAHAVIDDVLRQVPEVRIRVDDGQSEAPDARIPRLEALFRSNHWTVTIDDRRGRSLRFTDALRKAWPATIAPPLPTDLRAPPREPLQLACSDQIERAYAQSGLAVPRALALLRRPPDRRASRILLRRWAYAMGQLSVGRTRTALPHLEGVHEAYERGELGPTWRAGLPKPHDPAVAIVQDHLLVFDDGTFEARDLQTGSLQWRRTVGAAHPYPTAIDDHRLLLLLEDRVEAIETATGRTIWQAERSSAHPEVASDGERVFVADHKDLVAYDAENGDVAWDYDGLVEPVAGPVLVNGRLALPMGGKLAVLQPENGLPVIVHDLGDEVSAPLAITRTGGVWALVGSDEVVYLAPGLQKVGRRTADLPGVEWPAAVLREALVFVGGSRRDEADLRYLAPSGRLSSFRGEEIRPPVVVAAKDAMVIHRQSGQRVLVGRDSTGTIQWSTRFKDEILDWASADPHVAVAAGTKVVLLDVAEGSIDHTIELGAPILAVVYGPRGGAALLQDGTLYGLPSYDDPRSRVLSEDARITLAKAYLRIGRLSPAREVAERAAADGMKDLRLTALLARIDSRTKASAAVPRWLQIADDAPEGDPLREEAQQALDRLAGIVRIAAEPVTDASLADEWLVFRTTDTIEGRRVAQPNEVGWTVTGGDLGPVEGSYGVIDGQWFDLHTGTSTTESAARPVIARVQTLTTTVGATVELVDGGQSRWSRQVPVEVLRTQIEDPVVLVLERDGVSAWSAEDGEPRWRAPLEATVSQVWWGDSRVVVRSTTGVHGLDARTGAARYHVPMPSETPLWVGDRDFVSIEGQQVKFFDRRRGQRVATAALPGPGRAMTAAAGILFVTLPDGQLVSIDPRRRRLLGRASLGAVRAVGSRRHLAVLDRQGRLMLVDARRALRPRG